MIVACSECNSEAESDAVFCKWCDNHVRHPEVGKRAGLFRRAVALVIDPFLAILLWFSAVFTGGLVAQLFGTVTGTSNRGSTLGLSLVLALLFTGSYFCWFLRLLSRGRTPGKLLLGLQVVDERTATRPGFGKMFVREVPGRFVSGLLFGLGYLWAVIDRDSQAFHDKIARTVVIFPGNRIAEMPETSLPLGSPKQQTGQVQESCTSAAVTNQPSGQETPASPQTHSDTGQFSDPGPRRDRPFAYWDMLATWVLPVGCTVIGAYLGMVLTVTYMRTLTVAQSLPAGISRSGGGTGRSHDADARVATSSPIALSLSQEHSSTLRSSDVTKLNTYLGSLEQALEHLRVVRERVTTSMTLAEYDTEIDLLKIRLDASFQSDWRQTRWQGSSRDLALVKCVEHVNRSYEHVIDAANFYIRALNKWRNERAPRSIVEELWAQAASKAARAEQVKAELRILAVN